VPLLALLLAREGIPVLIHGVTQDPGRVTTREVLGALGIAPAGSPKEALKQLSTRRVAFLPIETLAPPVARTLGLRAKLGVRNSAHTLAKMLQPFNGSALRIVSVTHPDYLTRMREYFTSHDSAALLLRGAEGEAAAHPRRDPVVEWAFRGHAESWKEEATELRGIADLPADREASTTARWIEAALAGKAAVPAAIAHQVSACRRALDAMAAGAKGRP
jgi:anthranilate phosphoribosyltransferase